MASSQFLTCYLTHMRFRIRNSDVRLSSGIWPILIKGVPLLAPSSAISKWFGANIPDWLFPTLIEFAIASVFWDPFASDSRIRQIWRFLTDVFEVEHLVVQSNWSNWDRDGGMMPETDIGARLRIRFVKRTEGQLILRIFQCTGQGRKPIEHVAKLGKIVAEKGEIQTIPIVDHGISVPGWDPNRVRGWGPDKLTPLVGGSRNIAILELRRGLFIQKHKFFVMMISHNGKHCKPSIYVQDENEDVFDTSAEAKAGSWRFI